MDSTPNFTSQTHQMRELAKQGKWPPEGYPFRELALLPPQVVESIFQGEMWASVLAGLRLLRADFEQTALDSAKAQALREQACGVVNFIDNYMLELDKEITRLQRFIREAKESK